MLRPADFISVVLFVGLSVEKIIYKKKAVQWSLVFD